MFRSSGPMVRATRTTRTSPSRRVRPRSSARAGVSALASEELRHGGGLERASEQVSLAGVATCGAQRFELFGLFDAFRDHVELQVVADADDRAHHHRALHVVVAQLVDE